MSDLTGKVAIITGGGKGNGLAIARAFVKEGAAVTITDISQDALDAAKSELEALGTGVRVLAMVADNRDHEAANTVVTQTVGEFGRIDVLVNNAQQFRTSIAVEDTSWDDLVATYESGVFGAWRFMTAALPHLKDSAGTIIGMGSGAGAQARPLHAAYGSNKEAWRALSRIAAKEWGRFGITVNMINPLVATAESARQEREHPDIIAKVLAAMPLGRWGDAELNVGGLCVFLAKPEGKYMTGQTFNVDGGADIRP
jgi:NAD(P)-dependent dehydrogenase (short-subunit alcohol dehydrogenase family)